MKFLYNNREVPLLIVPIYLIWLNISIILHWGAAIVERILYWITYRGEE